MNVVALTLKENWLRLPFNCFEVRLKGNNNIKIGCKVFHAYSYFAYLQINSNTKPVFDLEIFVFLASNYNKIKVKKLHQYDVLWGLNWWPGPGKACALSTEWEGPYCF